MATFTWVGSASNSWPTAANWVPSGGPPAVGDDVIIPKTALRDLQGNLDRTGDGIAGLHLNTFRTAEGSTVKVGGPGNPLKLTANRFVVRGLAPVFIDSEDSGLGLGIVELHIVGSSRDTTVAVGGSVGITSIFVARGNVTVSNGGTISQVMLGNYESADDSRLRINSTTSNISRTVVNGGDLTCLAPQTELLVFGGTHTQTDGAVTLASVLGGRFNLDTTATVTTLEAVSGTVDLLRTSGVKTITTGYVWNDCRFLYAEDFLTGTIHYVEANL